MTKLRIQPERRPSANRRPGAAPHSRTGFTLVEMLVAVGLVMLMMSLFATVFQLATGSMTTQKGIAENDQRARTLVNLLKSDLDKRTFRHVLAFRAKGTGYDPKFELLKRQNGYFYIAENDKDNDTDDVLQFTMFALQAEAKNGSDQSPYYGRATRLESVNFLQNPNQPEADDAQAIPNSTGSSNYAEVCYFLRHGVLYRRTMLIRKPIADDYNKQPSPQSDGKGTPPLINGNYVPTSGNSFWNDFDYSAYHNGTTLTFHATGGLPGIDPLDNSSSGAWPVYTLGAPNWRFGFAPPASFTSPPQPPIEFINSGNTFIGRFTQEETSNVNFTYPSLPPGDTNNPFTRTDLADTDNDGVVDQYAKGPRQAEDMLMANVHSFDIKVWDEGTTASIGSFTRNFYDLGHNTTGGTFATPAANPTYGNRFDTWHPDIPAAAPPPYRRVDSGMDGQPGVVGIDDDGNGTVDIDGGGNIDYAEQGWPGSDDRGAMKAIQIKIRYLDIGSNQMRELTIVHSLVDRN